MTQDISEVKPVRRFIGRKSALKTDAANNVQADINNPILANPIAKSRHLGRDIPEYILRNEALNEEIRSILPSNYNFEIHKIIHHIIKQQARNIGLQFPEGLLMFSCAIADIIHNFFNALHGIDTDAMETGDYLDISILGDVTYGACCIDDFFCHFHEIDLLVHFGHSCLIPVNKTLVKIMYIFVDIKIDLAHFIDTVKYNFGDEYSNLRQILPANPVYYERMDKISPIEMDKRRLIFVSTVQFSNSLQIAATELMKHNDKLMEEGKEFRFEIIVPKSKPLSPGELLGCTSPVIYNPDDNLLDIKPDAIVYLGDGRFHMESIIIQNPLVQAYMYNPYTKKLTKEYYHHDRMHQERKSCIAKVKQLFFANKNKIVRIGIILGTLGRQGNKTVFDSIISKINVFNSRSEELNNAKIEFIEILISEIFPAKLELFGDAIEAYVQIACPRLSIDWGPHFTKPLLTPYELNVTLDYVAYQTVYPMDFYAHDSLGDWTPNHTPKNYTK